MICKDFLCCFLNICKTMLGFLYTLDERLDVLSCIHVISILLQPLSSTPPARTPIPVPHPRSPSDWVPVSPSANIPRGRVCKIQLHARPFDSIQHHFSF